MTQTETYPDVGATTPASRPARRKRQNGLAWLILLVPMVLLVAMPVLVFEGHIAIEPEKFAESAALPGVLPALFNTFAMSAGSVVLALIFGVTMCNDH